MVSVEARWVDCFELGLGFQERWVAWTNIWVVVFSNSSCISLANCKWDTLQRKPNFICISIWKHETTYMNIYIKIQENLILMFLHNKPPVVMIRLSSPFASSHYPAQWPDLATVIPYGRCQEGCFEENTTCGYSTASMAWWWWWWGNYVFENIWNMIPLKVILLILFPFHF